MSALLGSLRRSHYIHTVNVEQQDTPSLWKRLACSHSSLAGMRDRVRSRQVLECADSSRHTSQRLTWGHSRVSGRAVRWVQDVFKDVAVERTGQNGLAGITLYATFGLLQLVGGCLDIATSALQVLAQDAGVSDSSYAQLAFARAGFPSSVSQSGVCEMWNALTCSPASRDRRSIARYR